MTDVEYQDYRNRVEAKATGANIHKVRGYLGLVTNCIYLLSPSDKYNPSAENVKRLQDTQQKAITDIAIATGVHP